MDKKKEIKGFFLSDDLILYLLKKWNIPLENTRGITIKLEIGELAKVSIDYLMTKEQMEKIRYVFDKEDKKTGFRISLNK